MLFSWLLRLPLKSVLPNYLLLKLFQNSLKDMLDAHGIQKSKNANKYDVLLL